jgi:hypothetical protein
MADRICPVNVHISGSEDFCVNCVVCRMCFFERFLDKSGCDAVL